MTKYIDICYFRVSKKDETEQDLDHQIEAVIKKFNLTDPIVFKERGSAYKLEKIEDRTEFFKMLNLLFDADTITLSEIFKGKMRKGNYRLFVFGYDRIMRNLELNMLFSLLQYLSGNETFSYKEDYISNKRGESSIERLTAFLLISISAQASEGYSEAISKNTKKSFRKIGKAVFSRKGNKVGRRFKDLDGNQVKIKEKKLTSMNNRIIELCQYYDARNYKGYYALILDKIKEEFGLDLCKAYITKLRAK